MHIAPVPPLRTVALGIALLMLLGCAAQPPPPPPKVLTAEEAAARTVVPLTRPIALDKAGQIVDLEFELPPVTPDEVPRLIIGLRIWGADAKKLIAEQQRIQEPALRSRVSLQRLDGDGAPVALSYRSRDRREELHVAPGADIPYTTESSVATGSLWMAGLVNQRTVYGVARIAETSPVEPGRFRLQIALPEDRPDLKDMNVELLLAYGPRAK